MHKFALAVVAIFPQQALSDDSQLLRFIDWDNSIEENHGDVKVFSDAQVFLGFLSDTITIYPTEHLLFRITRNGIEADFNVYAAYDEQVESTVKVDFLSETQTSKTESIAFCGDQLGKPAGDLCYVTGQVDTNIKTEILDDIEVSISRRGYRADMRPRLYVSLSHPTIVHTNSVSVRLDDEGFSLFMGDFPDNSVGEPSSSSSIATLASSSFTTITGNFTSNDTVYLNGMALDASPGTILVGQNLLNDENEVLVRRSANVANCRHSFSLGTQVVSLTCSWYEW